VILDQNIIKRSKTVHTSGQK